MSDLQNQLDQANSNLKGLNANLEAHKQMLNETLQAVIQLRTNLVLYQQAHTESSQANAELIKQLEFVKTENENLLARVVELSAPSTAAQCVNDDLVPQE